MATTYTKLRNTVAAFMHRNAAAFVVDGEDLLLTSINNAKNFCQRAVDFEKAKVQAQLLNVSVANGANISGATLYGTATPVVMKSIERCFMAKTDGSGEFPVDFITRNTYVRRFKVRYEEAINREDAKNLDSLSTGFPLGVVQHGDIVFPLPSNTDILGGSTVNLYFDALEWLADFTTTAVTGTTTSTTVDRLVDSGATFITDGVAIGDPVSNTTDSTSALITAVLSETSLELSGDIFTSGEGYSVATVDGTQTNFLLDYAFDYMIYRAIFELNFFLKEDERVMLSDRILTDTWNNVIRWNASIIGNSVDDANLD